MLSDLIHLHATRLCGCGIRGPKRVKLEKVFNVGTEKEECETRYFNSSKEASLAFGLSEGAVKVAIRRKYKVKGYKPSYIKE